MKFFVERMKVDEFCGKQPREREREFCVYGVCFNFSFAGNGMEAAAI